MIGKDGGNDYLSGTIMNTQCKLLGVFDGLGGEERGEDASLIAAQTAAEYKHKKKPEKSVAELFIKANDEICKFAENNQIASMGTTAAVLAYGTKEIVLCNIGDSKIFRYSENKLEQISKDHVSVGVYGRKPPLSQYLGIPSDEIKIVPYVAHGYYNPGDIYLICSDGLTDMVSVEEIERIIEENDFKEICKKLLNQSLENGGKDNITIIVSRVLKKKLFMGRRTK